MAQIQSFLDLRRLFFQLGFRFKGKNLNTMFSYFFCVGFQLKSQIIIWLYQSHHHYIRKHAAESVVKTNTHTHKLWTSSRANTSSSSSTDNTQCSVSLCKKIQTTSNSIQYVDQMKREEQQMMMMSIIKNIIIIIIIIIITIFILQQCTWPHVFHLGSVILSVSGRLFTLVLFSPAPVSLFWVSALGSPEFSNQPSECEQFNMLIKYFSLHFLFGSVSLAAFVSSYTTNVTL